MFASLAFSLGLCLLPASELPLSPSQDPVPASSPNAAGAAAEALSSAPLDALEIELGGGLPRLIVPQGERLVYNARVSLGPVEATIGRVTLSGDSEEYRPGLLLPGPGAREGDQRTGILRAAAEGRYQSLYVLDAQITTRFLPQEWPRVRYFYEQRGTEKRRREILLGQRGGEGRASYRSDTGEGAPRGTRIWKRPQERDLPYPMAVDTMGAIYLVRTMVADELEELSFPMVTKLRLWDVNLRRGESAGHDLPAGRFHAQQVLLSTQRHPDDPQDGRFEGLFGMHGDIEIWVDPATGIPVRVVGQVPLGSMLEIGVDMQLAEYSGTPPSFAPLGAQPAPVEEPDQGEQDD